MAIFYKERELSASILTLPTFDFSNRDSKLFLSKNL
jgi:hypothetical protein